MKVVSINEVPKQILGAPLFTGEVARQSPIVDREGSQLSVDYVYFPRGIRNKWHKHSNDQVLIVLKGQGVVATRNHQVTIREGDVVWAPAGEEHWHGATDDSDFSHVSVTLAHTGLEQLEK